MRMERERFESVERWKREWRESERAERGRLFCSLFFSFCSSPLLLTFSALCSCFFPSPSRAPLLNVDRSAFLMFFFPVFTRALLRGFSFSVAVIPFLLFFSLFQPPFLNFCHRAPQSPSPPPASRTPPSRPPSAALRSQKPSRGGRRPGKRPDERGRSRARPRRSPPARPLAPPSLRLLPPRARAPSRPPPAPAHP